MTSQSKSKTKPNQRRHEEHENHERWLVSYADFITLLFAFFVVLYATSNTNQDKQKTFEKSIKVNFHLQGEGPGEKQGEGLIEAQDKKTGIESTLAELNLPLGIPPKSAGSREMADYVERSLDKSMSNDQKKNAIQKITHDAVGARVTLATSTFFISGSAKLKPTALESLDMIANLLKTNERRIIVEGHTDDTPISDLQYPSNWELAGGRASAVVRYLIKVHNLDPQRFISLSYGDQKPIAPNDTEEHKSMNRRIEILIVTDEGKASI